MKFLADECCDASLVSSLRSDGHDVLFAVESLRGMTDEDLLKRAFSERRILLTEDKDFGGLVYRLQYLSHGIILLRHFNSIECPPGDTSSRIVCSPALILAASSGDSSKGTCTTRCTVHFEVGSPSA